MTMRIENVSRLTEKLRGLPDAARTAAVGEINAASERIRDRAMDNAPVGEKGDLRKSIRAKKADRGLDGRVGSNLFYARFQEFGTRKMAARPFLFPAAETERRTFPARLAAAIDAANRREAR